MTTTPTEPLPASSTGRARPFNIKRFAIATAAGIVANLAIFAMASASGASLAVSAPQAMAIPSAVVLIASLVPAALAGVVTWLIARRRPGFRAVAQWLGLALALVSIVSAVISAADPGTAVALSLMHVVCGIAWFVGVGTPGTR